MPYVDPITVISPRGSWKLKQVLYNSAQASKQGGWSVAEGEWDGEPVIGVRWNGSDAEEGVGNPQSRGHATWFVIPDGLKDAVLGKVEFMKQREEMVSCSIERPDGYQHGAWRVVVGLGKRVQDQLGDSLVFAVPNLPNRMIIPDRNYLCATGGEFRGAFKDGQWLGDVYSNGITEDDNPTSVEAVRDAIVENVMTAVQLRGTI